MRYAVVLIWDNNGSAYVAIPDFPAILVPVANRDDALGLAKDAIETAIAAAMRASEDIPWPDARGDDFVRLSALSVAKIKLYRTMRAEGVARYELAKRIGVTPSRISRLLDLRHHSRIDGIEHAFAALDRSISIAVTRRLAAGTHGRKRVEPKTVWVR